MTTRTDEAPLAVTFRGWLGGALASSRTGATPVVIGLMVIWGVFQSQNDRFLSAANLSNLTLQIAATGFIAVGLFLVLMIAEIDIAVGIVSGVAGALLAVLIVEHGVGQGLAIVVVLGAGLVIGGLHGLIVTKLGVPSFVTTLAGLIAWQGALLYLLGNGGSINIPPGAVISLMSSYLHTQASISLGVGAVGLYLMFAIRNGSSRSRLELPVEPYAAIALRATALAMVVGFTIVVLERHRGVPLALVIFVGVVVATDLLVRFTQFGRRMLAVGGSPEAARRAGIQVERMRVTLLALCSCLAAFGGIMSAGRLQSVSASAGSGDIMLNAIAAVVIGGTSLFGGRGTAYSALLGMLVIGSISNGMDLLSLSSSVKFTITGLVLLIAVSLDSMAIKAKASR